MLLGECKFKNSKVTISDCKDLKKCCNDMPKYYYIFSKSGFKEILIELSKKANINLISLEEICNKT